MRFLLESVKLAQYPLEHRDLSPALHRMGRRGELISHGGEGKGLPVDPLRVIQVPHGEAVSSPAGKDPHEERDVIQIQWPRTTPSIVRRDLLEFRGTPTADHHRDGVSDAGTGGLEFVMELPTAQAHLAKLWGAVGCRLEP